LPLVLPEAVLVDVVGIFDFDESVKHKSVYRYTRNMAGRENK